MDSKEANRRMQSLPDSVMQQSRVYGELVGVPVANEAQALRQTLSRDGQLGRVAQRFLETADTSTEIGRTFVDKTVPKVLAFLSSSKRYEIGRYTAQHEEALLMGLQTMQAAAEAGQPIRLVSPICPPYNYTIPSEVVNKEAPVTHYDGQILPTIGQARFGNFLQATQFIFSDLLEQGVPVDLQVLSYTGGTDVEGLFEIGEDVLLHYQNDGETLLTNLRQATQEGTELCEQVSGNGFRAEMRSIETEIVPLVMPIYEQFCAEYGVDTMDDEQAEMFINAMSNPETATEMDAWFREQLGLPLEFLTAFTEEEAGYRRKQGVPLDRGLIQSSLREGLAYYAMINYMPGAVLWGAETTTNYTHRLFDIAGPKPSMMLRPLNRANPNDPLSLRGPFNPVLIRPEQAAQVAGAAGLTVSEMEERNLIRLYS